MWGAWYSTTQQDDSDITIGTREETEVLFGDTFYTQRLITWDLSPYATAFGAWAGIDTSRLQLRRPQPASISSSSRW